MTSSADLTAAGGAWGAIGIMDDKDLHDEDTTAWTQRLRTRAGLNDIHDMVGGASLCWGSKDERTVFAGEAIALLMAMRSLRLEHERAGVELPQTVCPIDNSGVVRKYKRILQKTQQELATEAAADIWVEIQRERRAWRKLFKVTDVKSHQLGEDCDTNSDSRDDKARKAKEDT